ncbi:unnamed protein product [Cuscuta campestris]|uniref:Protein kinase domain-containing protein n=1 Tax=Cuscuta campestris TaxID=132261 RepID=A0A484L1W5_9ASTE|nr:unnamed protein product [Cuscuta campestris]
MPVTRNRILVFCFFILFFTAAAAAGALVDQNECRETRCGRHGPAVKFPFWIKERQPAACGYPGFDLICASKTLLLQLPNSVNLSVRAIDYASQSITVAPWGCPATMFRKLNVSSSPFQFVDGKDEYTLLNCTVRTEEPPWPLLIPCLSDPGGGYQVFALYSLNGVGGIFYDFLQSCTKMYDITVPESVLTNPFKMNWSWPVCRFCEEEGKYCKLVQQKTNQTECYDLPTQGSIKKKVIAGAVLGSVFLIAALVVVCYKYTLVRAERKYQIKVKKFLDDYKALKPTRFLFADLERMTNQFWFELGKGGYGTVFKGKLSDDVIVAVKVLNDSKAKGEEFINEVGTLAKIHHANIVRLIGFCAEGFKRAIVYEYLPNDSLQRFISSADSKNHFLGWKSLERIAIGIAKGIEYLHRGCDERILHFDIRPHNVLLDHNLNPKMTDFGLAKLCSTDQSLVSMTTARGTIGYMAPEVFSRNFGKVSYKSDVYSFGMLLLEMVSGRRIVDTESNMEDQVNFPEWIYNVLDQGEDLRFDIEEEIDVKIGKKLAIVGLLCIQWNPVHRPSMGIALQMLEGEGDDLSAPLNPFIAKAPSTRNTSAIANHIRQRLEAIEEVE